MSFSFLAGHQGRILIVSNWSTQYKYIVNKEMEIGFRGWVEMRNFE
jgi:hypothetical protein